MDLEKERERGGKVVRCEGKCRHGEGSRAGHEVGGGPLR